MQIDFFYWGAQCPLTCSMLDLFGEFCGRFRIVLHDVAKTPAEAVRQRMFFPFLTVIEGKTRYFSPVNRRFLLRLLAGGRPEEKPEGTPKGKTLRAGCIFPVTRENISLAGRCAGRNCPRGCEEKGLFLSRLCGGVFGFLNEVDGKLLGGAEFVPSLSVPYAIPKDARTAFLTCVYLSSDEYDAKTAPLAALEEYLRGHYDRLAAVSGEEGTFPNGPLPWFLERGYRDEGVLSVEPGVCRLHLVSKRL